jgi:hypothetical protein
VLTVTTFEDFAFSRRYGAIVATLGSAGSSSCPYTRPELLAQNHIAKAIGIYVYATGKTPLVLLCRRLRPLAQ